jgi:hypothetical protein
MLYSWANDPLVRCLLAHQRTGRFTAKDYAYGAEVDVSLVYGWLRGQRAPLACTVPRLTARLNTPVFLNCLAEETSFRIVPHRILRLPSFRDLLFGYFAAQAQVTQSPAFRKLMEGEEMTEEEFAKLLSAIEQEEGKLAQLRQTAVARMAAQRRKKGQEQPE